MDTNSNLSPVTESEVMTFASRICTTIVAHSQQQGRIESLERSLTETTSERDHLRSENARLNQDIGETTSLADGYSRERDDAMRRVQELEGKLRYQEEMAISRDAKVAELQTKLQQVEQEARTKSQEAERNFSQVRGLQDELELAKRERDGARNDLREVTSRMADFSTKLEKIPFAIRSHFTGETEPKPEPQTAKPETAKDVPITETTEWKPSGPEMKPAWDDHKEF